ncbi:hypothetical protein [Amycolatopsis orientalis]|uniref:hypothetical protein n=1 Tax=Amycolatopsis orientalis TaxID=31958 RepID=UPI001319C8FF|nr:hypothetical protein [Amycolatopsis orientalis]
MRRTVLAAIALLSLTACSDVDGVRVAGPAPPASAVPAPASNPRGPTVDAVALLRADPTVSARTKEALRPCPNGAIAGSYPVRTAYHELTGEVDVVVNVYPCAAAGAPGTGSSGAAGVPVSAYLGGYVYTVHGKQLFKLENSGALLTVLDGQLATMSATGPNNGVTRYRWTGRGFSPE